MADASFIQSDFLGGEWSPYSQGRIDLPTYRAAMNSCLNAHPIETGAWVRRSGTRFLGTTRAGSAGRVIAFDFTQTAPYLMEFTDGHLRFYSRTGIVQAEQSYLVTNVSTANPAQVTVFNGNAAWASGDQVIFEIDAPGVSTSAQYLLGRQFFITAIDANNFTIRDAVTGSNIDGSLVAWASSVNVRVVRVLDLITPYTVGAWQNLRAVQDETTVLLLHPAFAPQTVAASSYGGGTFAFAAANFIDGPYLDPPTDARTLTPSGVSGSITIVTSTPTFTLVTDVGRMVRIFAGPVPADPTLDTRRWTWGVITAVATTQSATLLVKGDPLVSTAATALFRLGTFSDTTGWPTCGTYHEGRLWLAGSIPNRVDAGVVSKHGLATGFVFSPTAPDGTVADNNGMSLIFDSPDQNVIYWLIPDAQGILCGTIAGEWLIRASQLADPLTPTSIQVARVTRYGCANIEPKRAGLAIAFVQRYARKLQEFVCDLFSSKFAALNLSTNTKHLTTTGIAEIAYQSELLPVVWARCEDGSLVGTTYKRDSLMISQPPAFNGWHRHKLGSGRLVMSVANGPSPNGLLDSLSMVTKDPDTGVYWVEMLTELFDEQDTILNSWFADGATTPAHAQVVTISGSQYLQLSGLWNLEGKVVSAFIGGIDAGDWPINNGIMNIPVTAGFSLAALKVVSDAGGDFGGVAFKIQVPRPTAANSTIQWYPLPADFSQPDPVTNYNSAAIATDFDSGRVYFSNPGGTSDCGIRRYDYKTALQALDIAYTPLLNNSTLIVPSEMVATAHGKLLFRPQHSNGGWLLRYKGDDFTLTASTDQSFNVSGFNGVLGINSFASVQTSTGHDVIVIGTAVFGEIQFVSVDGMTIFNTFQLPGSSPVSVVCKGGVDRAFAVARTKNSTPDPILIYSIALSTSFLPGAVCTQIKSLAPAAIDATWTNIYGVQFVVYDETDGNIICQVNSPDAVTNQCYLMKLDGHTGNIIWKTAVNLLGSTTPMNQARIRNGTLGFLDGSNHFQLLQTASGSMQQLALGSIGITGAQVWDDVTQLLTFYGYFSGSGTNAPVPLGTTPPAGYGSRWGQLYVLNAAQPIVMDTYEVPGLVGFTYTSQGQLLRPEMPQDTGARNGPGFGKTRRIHKYAMRVVNTTGLSIGTDFSNLFPVRFKSPGGVPYSVGQLYSGEYVDTLHNDYSLEGMICWQVTRPYPANIIAIGGMIQTQDR
jgi:hypothetical protein